MGDNAQELQAELDSLRAQKQASDAKVTALRAEKAEWADKPRRLKLPDVKEYDGKQPLMPFLESCNEFLEGHSDSEKVKYLISRCTGHTQEHLRKQRDLNRQSSPMRMPRRHSGVCTSLRIPRRNLIVWWFWMALCKGPIQFSSTYSTTVDICPGLTVRMRTSVLGCSGVPIIRPSGQHAWLRMAAKETRARAKARWLVWVPKGVSRSQSPKLSQHTLSKARQALMKEGKCFACKQKGHNQTNAAACAMHPRHADAVAGRLSAMQVDLDLEN
ncbi:TPA: hypothetical protein ACH3X1_016777 [Trebouxia sp. C0004]